MYTWALRTDLTCFDRAQWFLPSNRPGPLRLGEKVAASVLLCAKRATLCKANKNKCKKRISHLWCDPVFILFQPLLNYVSLSPGWLCLFSCFFSIAVFSCFSSVLFGLPLCCLDSALPIWICLPHWLIYCVQNPVLAFKTILTAALCLQLCNWIQELLRTSPLPVHGIFFLKGKAVCNYYVATMFVC